MYTERCMHGSRNVATTSDNRASSPQRNTARQIDNNSPASTLVYETLSYTLDVQSSLPLGLTVDNTDRIFLRLSLKSWPSSPTHETLLRTYYARFTARECVFTRPWTRIPRVEDDDKEICTTRLIARNITPSVQFLKQSVLEALHEDPIEHRRCYFHRCMPRGYVGQRDDANVCRVRSIREKQQFFELK